MSTNLYGRFTGLIPDRRQDLVTYIADNGDGTSTVESSQGSQFRIQGSGYSNGDKVITQGGRIVTKAASLPTYLVPVS